MKYIFIFFGIFLSLNAMAQHYESCSICLVNSFSEQMNSECKGWFANKEQKGSRFNLVFNTKKSVFKKGQITCENLRMWGAYHGASFMYAAPFEYAKNAAKAFEASSVSYDGSTCLVFNNLDLAKAEALKLAREIKNIKFQISGNQNEGAVSAKSYVFFSSDFQEDKGQASKVTYTIQDGQLSTSYGACSTEGKLCSFTSKYEDHGATSDSNTKTCVEDRRVTQQICCENRRNPGFGQWSAPGDRCR